MTDEAITKALARVAEQVAEALDRNRDKFCQAMQAALETSNPEKAFRMPLSFAVVLTPLQRDINVRTKMHVGGGWDDVLEDLVSTQPTLGLDMSGTGE